MNWQTRVANFQIGDTVQYRTESRDFTGTVIGFEALPSRRVSVEWDIKDMLLPQYTDASNLVKMEQPPQPTEIIRSPNRPTIR